MYRKRVSRRTLARFGLSLKFSKSRFTTYFILYDVCKHWRVCSVQRRSFGDSFLLADVEVALHGTIGLCETVASNLTKARIVL